MINKDDSGFRWGPFNIVGPRPWPLRIQQLGGSVHYPYAYHPARAKISHGPQDVDPEQPVIMKGNYFDNFTHMRDLGDAEVYYWDNCLIPQLMNRNPANPRGDKIWCRLVYKSTAPQEFTGTDHELQEQERRVNQWIGQESQGHCGHWRDLITIRKETKTSKRILVCLSSTQLLSHWYGEDLALFKQKILRVADRQGWTVVFRDKKPRNHRQGTDSLEHQLRSEPWRAVICTHSALATEVIAQGIPCVALGAQPIGDLATTWSEFCEDQFRPFTPESAENSIRQLLPLTRHKQELLSGSWSQDWAFLHTPYNQWRIYD